MPKSTNIIYQITLISILLLSTIQFNLTLVQPTLEKQSSIIYKQSILQKQYNDATYNKITTCTNGQLSIIQFNRNLGNASILIKYQGINVTAEKINVISSSKQIKTVVDNVKEEGLDTGIIEIKSGCFGDETNVDRYFNKVDVIITENDSYRFSFLLGCDQGGRNKKFQIGYLVIALINAAITIGVALHSHIWSIRYGGRPLSLELKWHRFLIIMLVITLIGIAVYFYAADQFKNANELLNYFGLAVAYIFSFVCCDQIFFLIRACKKQVYKMIRICDILSFIVSTIMLIVGFFVQSWVYNNILALGICVGAIKLLRFSSMKQAYLSMAISVVTVSIFTGVLHFVVERSYNDYASQVSSPLFLLIPDFIEQLYKKCSWLPVIDVIVPGVFLSFLRTYDANYNTGWGGVYTVIGNLSFIISTLLWILIQALYPYSVPFSSVTYSFLALAIFLMSTKRNQFKTLWTGRFNGANNELTTHMLPDEENRKSFGKLVTPDIIQSVKYDEEKDNQYRESFEQTSKNKMNNRNN